MLDVASTLSARHWAEQTFGQVRLGDERRRQRAVQIATALAQQPDASLPAQMQDPMALKGAYRFLENPKVSYQALIQPPVEQTRAACRQRKVVLLVQDTTEVDHQHHAKTRGLGPIGNGTHQGYLLQTVLAIDPVSQEVLGIAQQEPFLRQSAPKGEDYKQRQKRERESQVWERAVEAIGQPPEGVQWVHVGDRYSDMYGFFWHCLAQQTQFVVRAAQERCVDPAVEQPAPPLKRRKRKADEPATPHLFETIAAWPSCAQRELAIPAQHGQPARTAQLELSYGPLRMLAPDKQERHLPALTLWVVRVWEAQPPVGCEPIEWVLWTSVPTQTVEEAWLRVDWYSGRWVVEDFHQGLKTGCRLQERHVQTYEGLVRLLGFLAPLAVRLLQLRAHARQAPQTAASQVLPAPVVQVLAHHANVAAAELCAERAWKTMARLGGYQDRKGDGPPGWKTLWKGWFYVQILLEGIRLAAHLRVDDSTFT